MDKQYFCERDVYHNCQYFYGGKVYDEYEINEGLPPRTQPQPLSDYLIQIRPKPKELDAKRKKLLRDALKGAASEKQDLTRYGKKARGVGQRLGLLNEIIDLLEPIAGKAQAVTA